MLRKKKSVVVASHPCEICSSPTALVAVIPEAPNLPELHTFRCSECGFRKTVQAHPAEETKVAVAA